MQLSPTAMLPGDLREGATPVPPPNRRSRWRLPLTLVAAVATGCAAAIGLPLVPLVPTTESGVTGAALLGFGLGWALLAGLVSRATGRRPVWAVAATAVFLASGALLLVFGAPAHQVLDWVWPGALVALGVGIVIAVHGQKPQLPGRVLYPVAALLVLASVGGGIETIAEAADARALPAPGRLVNVGDHRLHLRCVGTGSPIVVFEAGGGEMSSNLGLISSAVGRTTRICTYDRAGRGWSESAPTPPSGGRIAEDLHALLHRGGASGPFILAGHSFGGLYVRSFAARYPADVAGMVLVDSTAAAAGPADTSTSPDVPRRVAALLSVSARFGLARVIAASTADDLPAPFADEVLASGSKASAVESTLNEYIDAGSAAQDAAKLTDLGDKPLVVLTAGVGHPASWFSDQDRMSELSTNSVHRTVANADHQGLVGETKGAAATTKAILDAVESARGAQPLPQR